MSRWENREVPWIRFSAKIKTCERRESKFMLLTLAELVLYNETPSGIYGMPDRYGVNIPPISVSLISWFDGSGR
jgi:hypothetical protein